LTSDSSNAIELFKEAYKIIIENIAPRVVSNGNEGLVRSYLHTILSFLFSLLFKAQDPLMQLQLFLLSRINPPVHFNVTPGEPRTFEIELFWDDISTKDIQKEVRIDFLSFGSLSVLIDTEFECQCPVDCDCPANADCFCGRCECRPGFQGENCTCKDSRSF